MSEPEHIKPKIACPKNLVVFSIQKASTKGYWVYLGSQIPTLMLWSEDYPVVHIRGKEGEIKKTERLEAYMRVDVEAKHVRTKKIRLGSFTPTTGWSCFNNKGQEPNWRLFFQSQEGSSVLFDTLPADDF